MRNALPAEQRKTIKKQSVANVASKVFDNFLKFEKSVLTIATAVQLQRLLRGLRKLSFSPGENAARRAVQQAEEIRKC